MIAGFAEREYTPAEGFVPGQINVNYAKGKRTPLMAHVAVIESKGVGAVLIALDILFVSVDFAAKLRRRVSEITGVPTDRIMVACSHTHTGCAIDLDCWEFKGKPEYLDPVEDAIMAALNSAMASRREVKMGIATGFDAKAQAGFPAKEEKVAAAPEAAPAQAAKPADVADIDEIFKIFNR